MTGLIDCHTHLTDAVFDADREAVVERARRVGVCRVMLVGQDDGENEVVLRTAGGEPLFAACLGLHPDRFADRAPWPDPRMLERVTAQIRASATEIHGIGEVGLDRWVCQEEPRRQAQREAFARLIDLALELDLPLNVHSRSAGRQAIDLLLEKGTRRVLLHAFDGKAAHALRGAEMGYLFSVPPSVVRSPQKQKLVRALPMAALALETDSPVLGPEPGMRNEPANLTAALEAIASIKGLSVEEVAQATTANARRLFRLDEASDR